MGKKVWPPLLYSLIMTSHLYLKCAINDDLEWNRIKWVVGHDGRDKGFDDFDGNSVVVNDVTRFFDDVINGLGRMNSVVDEGLRLAWDHVDLDAGLDECYGLKVKVKLKSDLQVNNIATAF